MAPYTIVEKDLKTSTVELPESTRIIPGDYVILYRGVALTRQGGFPDALALLEILDTKNLPGRCILYAHQLMRNWNDTQIFDGEYDHELKVCLVAPDNHLYPRHTITQKNLKKVVMAYYEQYAHYQEMNCVAQRTAAFLEQVLK